MSQFCVRAANSGQVFGKEPPLIMGIVNVTPDSFSDGGRYAGAEAAVSHARMLISQGVDIIDIGGESTRPGAKPTSEDEELHRILPVVTRLVTETDVPISIDTRKPKVADAALALGARIWNDVSGLGTKEALAVAARWDCVVILMHMQGEPLGMQQNPYYQNVMKEVSGFLDQRAKTAESFGIAREKIWLDPGIGFGKNLEHNLGLFRGLPELVHMGYPLVLGASRKRFIQHLCPTATSSLDRLGGSIATALWGLKSGVRILRVHDVAETLQAIRVWQAFENPEQRLPGKVFS